MASCRAGSSSTPTATPRRSPASTSSRPSQRRRDSRSRRRELPRGAGAACARTPRPRTPPAWKLHSPPATSVRSPTLLADDTQTVSHPTGTEYGREGVARLVALAAEGPRRDLPTRTAGNPRRRRSRCVAGRCRRAGSPAGSSMSAPTRWRRSCCSRSTRRGANGGARSSPPTDWATPSPGCTSATPSSFPRALPATAPRRRRARSRRCWGRSDLDRYGTALAPAVEFVDHRTLGLGSVRGAEGILRGSRALLELADEHRRAHRRHRRPATRCAPRPPDELRHRSRRRRRLREALPSAPGLRSRWPR